MGESNLTFNAVRTLQSYLNDADTLLARVKRPKGRSADMFLLEMRALLLGWTTAVEKIIEPVERNRHIQPFLAEAEKSAKGSDNSQDRYVDTMTTHVPGKEQSAAVAQSILQITESLSNVRNRLLTCLLAIQAATADQEEGTDFKVG